MIGQRDIKLGKIMIVLAGSDPHLKNTMEKARSMGAIIPLEKGHEFEIRLIYYRESMVVFFQSLHSMMNLKG